MKKIWSKLSVGGPTIVAGLDIGTYKICLVVADVQPGGRVDVIGECLVKSSGVQHGVVTDMEEVGNVIAQALERAQLMAGAEVSSAVIGVSGEHIVSELSSGRAAISHPGRMIRREDVDRAVGESRKVAEPDGQSVIQAIVRGYSVDQQNGIKSPVGMTGGLLEAHALLIRGVSNYIQNIGRSVERAGLAVESFLPVGHADGLALLTAEDKAMGVAVVDIGAGTTDVAVYTSGSISFVGTIPIGADHITQDIAVGLQCALQEAERVKIDSGAAKASAVFGDADFSFRRYGASEFTKIPKSLLVEIIEPRVTEILNMVKEMLESREEASPLAAGIVLTGGSAALRGLLPVAESVFSAPCRIGSILNARGLTEVAATRSHVGAVGLALYAAEQAQPSMRPARRGGIWDNMRDVFSSADA